MGRIRAVVFDYYFTLADPTAPAARAAAAAVLDGVDYDAVWAMWRTMTVPDVERALSGEPPPFRRFATRWSDHGVELFRLAEVEDDGTAWVRARAASHEHAVVYDDVEPTLRQLGDAGLRLGVLSDADSAWFSASVTHTGLAVDDIVCSEDLGCYKPHPSVFLAACERLGVHPSEAAYVGDNPHVDVVGAGNAGMLAIWLNRRGTPYPDDLPPPDHTVTSLVELPALLWS